MSKGFETFKQLHVVHFQNFVKLEQVLKQDKNIVAEKTSLAAKRTVNKLVHDLADHSHEMLLVVQYVSCRYRARFFLHLVSFGLQYRNFEAKFQVQFNVVAVVSRDFLVHFRVVVLALAFVRLHELVSLVDLFATLFQHAMVLERAVEDDQ